MSHREQDQWLLIDPHILGGRKLKALARIRIEFACELQEALGILSARYQLLRQQSPADFAQDEDTYWEGFHC